MCAKTRPVGTVSNEVMFWGMVSNALGVLAGANQHISSKFSFAELHLDADASSDADAGRGARRRKDWPPKVGWRLEGLYSATQLSPCTAGRVRP